MGGGLLIEDDEASGSSVRSVQGPFGADAVRLADVENASPNSLKKMCTDHKNVTQRKCLLMRVPRSGTRRFNPHEECRIIRTITSKTPGTQTILHCRIISSITSLIGFSETCAEAFVVPFLFFLSCIFFFFFTHWRDETVEDTADCF